MMEIWGGAVHPSPDGLQVTATIAPLTHKDAVDISKAVASTVRDGEEGDRE